MARPDDGDGIRAIYAPFVADTPISFELDVPSVADMRRRVTELTAQHPWLVVEDERGIAGYAYGSAHRSRAAYGWSTDVSAYVRPDSHRRGLGSALYAALLELLHRQGYRQAFAGITLPNAASVGLHEAMGFVPVGVYRNVGWKLGRWHDVGWWQCGLGPPSPEPHTPRPVTELDPIDVGKALDLGASRLRPA
jgi:phosphinothricin acetyltransferase